MKAPASEASRLLIVAGISLAASSCAIPEGAGDAPHLVPEKVSDVCDLLARGSDFVGKQVYVRGLYAELPHQRVLVGENCSPKSLAVELQSTGHELRADRRMHTQYQRAHNSGIPSLYFGLVQADSAIAGCDRNECIR